MQYILAMNTTYPSNRTKRRAFRRHLPLIVIYAVTLAAFVISLIFFAQVILNRQGNLVYQEKIQAGKIGLSHFVNTAAIPLVDDDALSLNVLMKEAKSIQGALYVAVVDNKGTVKAHTDIRKVGSVFGTFEKGDRQVEKDGTVVVSHALPDGTQVLDLTRPVQFMQNQLGAVHVGLSLAFINAEVKKELSGLKRNIITQGLILLGILLCSALAFFFWLSRLKGQEPAGQSGRRHDDEQMFVNDEATAPTCRSGDDTSEGNGADTRNLSVAEMNQNHVTVLFAGIKGFRAYAEINDHQKLMDDLNDYLVLATQCIRTYGGHIDKFVGDSVIAVFGNAPHEANHAERAVKAAVAMQKALQDGGESGNQLLLKVGIGINSGVVLSGRIGSSDQNEQVFIGESIKVAYSLNFMAGPGEIVMTRDAYRMVEHLVTVEPMPPQVLMRRTQPWENFRLLKLNSPKR